MTENRQFENILLSNRKHLTPQQSIQNVVDYALISDSRLRSRRFTSAKANWILTLLLVGPPATYMIKGLVIGCWQQLTPDFNFISGFSRFHKPARLNYRPEIYLRDQQAKLHLLDKENIEKEKRGETPKTTSPIVLWN